MQAIPIVHYPCSSGNPYNRLLANALAAQGVPVTLQTALRSTNPARSLRWAWRCRLIHFHWIQGLYTGRSRWRFVLRSTWFLLLLLALRCNGTRLVLTVHNLVPHEHRFRTLHHLMHLGLGRIMHRLVVHSAPAAREVGREYRAAGKISVIEHIDYGAPPALPSRREARRRLGLTTERKILLFFGHIRPYKGVEQLLAAAPHLAELRFDLVIAGRPASAQLGEQLARQARGQDNIQLRLRELSESELTDFLCAADLVVFPYRDGLSSGAAHLALAYQRPFICSSSVAFEHLIARGLGFPFSTSEPSDLIRAVDAALAFDESQWRDAARDYLQRCQPESVGARTSELYRHLLSNQRGPLVGVEFQSTAPR